MLNSKNTPKLRHYLPMILLSLLAVPFFAMGAGTKQVLVIPDDNKTTTSLEKNLNGFKINEVATCISTKEIETYYKGSSDAYTAEKAKVGKCTTKLMNATLLRSEIADVQTSLGEIEKRIGSLNKTLAYINSLKDENGKVNLNGLSLFEIPVGDIETKSLDRADKIAMKCLQKTNAKNDDISEGLKDWLLGAGATGTIGAVGDLASENLSWFNTLPAKQLDILEKFKNENQITYKELQADLADDGKVSKGTAMSLFDKMSKLRDVMAENVISITAEDINKYPEEKKYSLSFGINYILTPDKKKQEIILPGYAKAAIAANGVFNSRMRLYDDVMISAKITLGDITYPEAMIGENTMLKGLREDSANHIKNLRKLSAQFGAIQKKLYDKLAGLNKDTSCN